jgi:uncharacterized phage protein gp47/JayE
MSTLGVTISSTGASAPSFAAILASLITQYQAIYGSDSVLTPDSPDGQWLAIQAQAINDGNDATIAVYNGFAPQYAQGVGLSNMTKINGLKRQAGSNSNAVVTIVGQAFSTITNGLVGDNANLGTKWALPASVTIPMSGTIDVTAVCTTPGAITAAAGSLTKILTPSLGWQSVTNGAAAAPGAAPESDPALRQRQSVSTALPGQAILDAIYANVAGVAGVQALKPYENASPTTDSNGLPPSSISFVVKGGAVQDIVNAIGNTKVPGGKTYGTTSGTYTDEVGNTSTINYFVLTQTTIYVSLTLTPLAGFATSTVALIQAALAQYVSTLGIGVSIQYNKLSAPANLSGSAAVQASITVLGGNGLTQAQLEALAATYEITALTVGIAPAPTGTVDVPIAFNAAAALTAGNVVVTT